VLIQDAEDFLCSTQQMLKQGLILPVATPEMDPA
jgi:hypothetical protein